MSEASHPAMDYDAHNSTYEQFVSLIKVSIVALINVLVGLVLFAFGGSLSLWTGTLIMFLTIIAGFVGLFAGPRGWIPSAVVLVLGLGLVVLTVG